MRKRLSVLVFLISASFFASAQVVPEITTVNVLPDNTVEVTFDQIAYVDFITEFPQCEPIQYVLKRANNLDGPYNPIQDYTYNQTVTPISFIDPTAQGNLGEKFYQVEIVSVGGCVGNSNIVASIHLELINVNGGAVDLSWNTENITEGAVQGTPSLFIDKRISGGIWLLDYFVGDADFNTFNEDINDCHLPNPDIFIEYRVRVENPNGVEVTSNVEGGTFEDQNPPEPPVIEVVTVDCNTGNLVIHWFPSVSPDIGGYKVISPNDEPAGTIVGGAQNNFEVIIPTPGNVPALGPSGYYVLGYDTCVPNDGAVTLGVNDLDLSVFLTVDYDVCTQAVELNWTAYEGWDAGVNKYEVWVQKDTGPLELFQVLDPFITDFRVEEVDPNVDYCFVVEAFCDDPTFTTKAAASNKVCFNTAYPDVAQNYGIEYVTVVDNNQTELALYVDQNPLVEGARYKLEKLNDFGDGYESIGTYPQNIADQDGKIFITDFDVDNDNKGDMYRVSALDSCLNVVSTSPISNSIHLEAFAEDGTMNNTLTWNPYVYWANDVQEYRVYFSHDKNMPVDPKFVLDPDAFFKIDDIEEFFQVEADFCYRIDAIKNNPETATSQSNIKCVNHKPLFFLPNAMVINGQNPVFKPEGGFIDFATYEMAIYNRWGTLLFKTEDFFEGWDGSYNGEFVRDGAYAYFIKYRVGDGTEKFRSGTMTVLRAF